MSLLNKDIHSFKAVLKQYWCSGDHRGQVPGSTERHSASVAGPQQGGGAREGPEASHRGRLEGPLGTLHLRESQPFQELL